MLLCNLHIVGKEGQYNIELGDGKINAVTESDHSIKTDKQPINFTNAIAFPGLINSHDHLDFNLFPQTGNRIYNNYTEWGKDIHQKNRESIDAVLKIPQHLRTQWGLYKNLLNGITTVVNHGEKLNIQENFIMVLQNNYSLHSVQFEKKWKLKLNRILIKRHPFVIHAGEGTDASSQKEIDELIKWNLLKRKIIVVHGVVLNEEQARHFKALVWCPSSNQFLLNTTANVDELKTKTSILFGTDSTLTASWNLWEHLRLARDSLLLTDEELFDSLTQTAATVWNQNNIGSLANNKDADICIADANNKKDLDAFYSVNPEDILLVMHKGEIRLFDEDIKDQLALTDIATEQFSKIYINGKMKYLFGDVPALINKVWSYYPDAYFPVSIK